MKVGDMVMLHPRGSNPPSGNVGLITAIDHRNTRPRGDTWFWVLWSAPVISHPDGERLAQHSEISLMKPGHPGWVTDSNATNNKNPI